MAVPIKTAEVQETVAAEAAPASTRTISLNGTRKWGDRFFGKDGFHSPAETVTTIDVGIIDQIVPSLLAQGIARQDGDAVTINTADMGIEKVLGSGKVTKKINISANAFTEQAKAKIEKMGGKALVV